MSTWRDKLQPASFRGVPFKVEGGDGEFGRRAFSVEYPYRDDPFVDDMGRRMRRINIEAILIDTGTGPDLFAQRNALIDALEKAGAATLIHPRLGAMRVQAEVGRWSFKAASNVERFSIPFIEAGANSQPQVSVDTLDRVRDTADAANNAQKSYFEKALQFQKQADFVVQAARTEINRGLSGVRDLARRGRAISDSISGFVLTVDSAINDVTNLVLTPRLIAAQVSTLVGQFLNLDSRVSNVLTGYRAIGALWGDVDPVPATTPSRITQRNNQTAIAQLFTNAATITAAQLIAQQASAIGVTSNALSPFDSADQATAVRDELVAALDAIALTADTELYNAVVELQSTLVAHIAAHGNALPRVSRVSYRDAMPMLVIAHRLDGTIDREADLIARNRIKHPLFVPAGRELEVLNG